MSQSVLELGLQAQYGLEQVLWHKARVRSPVDLGPHSIRWVGVTDYIVRPGSLAQRA